MSPPIVPQINQDVYFVLCDFGKQGQAYVETDPSQADQETVIRNLLAGEFDRPLSVMACNPAEGWARFRNRSPARLQRPMMTRFRSGRGPSLIGYSRILPASDE